VLFDLQSPRRRRAVRVVFGGLAAIFAISFVGFGVGTGGSNGGFLNSIFGGGGGSSASSSFDSDINAAQAQIQQNPNNANAHAQLAALYYQKANAEADSNGRPSSDGVQDLQNSTQAFTNYLKVAGAKPAAGPAAIAYQAYFVLAQADFANAAQSSSGSDQLQGLNNTIADLKGAANAQTVVSQARPNLGNWAKVAGAYALAGDTQGMQQAVAQAKKVDPKGAANLQKQLKSALAQGAKFQQAKAQLTKQLRKTQSAGGGGNPLSLSGGASSSGLGSTGTGGL
jgi:hypothetical protein